MKAPNGSILNVTQIKFYQCALGLEDLNLIANLVIHRIREDRTIADKTTPEQAFSDTVQAVLGNHSIRRQAMTEETYDKINLDKAFEVFKQRFADASDFTFVFVGNIEEPNFKEMVLGIFVFFGCV